MRRAHSVTRLGDLFLSGHTGQAQNKKRLFLTYAGRRQRTCLTRAPILLSSAYDVFTTSKKICKYVQTGFSWNCNILSLNMSEFYSVDRATPVFRKNAVRIPSRLFIIFCIWHFISSAIQSALKNGQIKLFEEKKKLFEGVPLSVPGHDLIFQFWRWKQGTLKAFDIPEESI